MVTSKAVARGPDQPRLRGDNRWRIARKPLFKGTTPLARGRPASHGDSAEGNRSNPGVRGDDTS